MLRLSVRRPAVACDGRPAHTERVREFDFPNEAVDPLSSDRVAERLDELQMDAVERVLRRAIELQSDDDHDLDTLDGTKITKIAEELGIDARHVEQALFEERVGDRVERFKLLDRLLAPPRVSGQTTVDGARQAVEAATDTWLERHEGLVKRRALPDGALWERDPSALTKIRMGLKIGRGSGALRSASSVAHRIYTTPSGQHLVGIDVDTRIIGRTARGLLAAATGFGLLMFVVLSSTLGWAQGIAAGLASFAAFTTAAVATAKTWTSRVRKGIRRALDAIASPGVAGVHDTIAERVNKTIAAWRDFGKDLRRKG